MKAFVRSICELIGKNETFVMATVVESTGSTPRSSGAKMAVRGDGSILGTVGGGLVEAKACKDGRAMLASGDGMAALTFVDMTQELAANSDMICGGGLSVLLEVVEPTGPCATAYKEVDALLRQGHQVTLVSRFEGTSEIKAVEHQLVAGPVENETPVFVKKEGELHLSEPFVPPASLFIFGAGHVSLFTARTAAMIGFRTVVLDDRKDFANTTRFPEADEVVVLPSFAGCCDGLGVDENSFVIIVTRGHMHDRNVLAEVLRTKARYVGMIGSTKKRDKIYASLLEDGLTQKDIDRCHCPIGLTIGAQTPEEIAVSICGELIQVRSGEV
ncbi:XdhC/CoxI family protein [Pseudodesulfovibrio sp. JC047]|uniref:XdhC family protein n=1 Tax=Pseudodesulfovibrio sp. JC047 TaxID=2683199 RepID=UPI0013D145C2|nr:XdhC/CoxI family protein [Pseudodesulfovibrio sp. JC047]NDV19875.1 XdhC/CoxI family protein [Pseudodesulfovibrio sp. JC047]